jgi:undecaprenyl-diphosphatase
MDIENQLFLEMNSLAGRFDVIDSVMIALSSAYTWIFFGFSLLVIISLRRQEQVLAAYIQASLALACSDFVSFRIIKPLIARERPCRILDDVVLVLNHCGGSYGFTSNHAANAFAVWASIAICFGSRSTWSLLGITLASAVAISRVYLGVHYWGDILGGALLGVLLAIMLGRLGLGTFSNTAAKSYFRYFPSSGK